MYKILFIQIFWQILHNNLPVGCCFIWPSFLFRTQIFNHIIYIDHSYNSYIIRQLMDQSSKQKENRMFVFNIDRGGTFTDFYVQEIKREDKIGTQQSYTIVNEFCFKVPSISQKGQGPTVGIRQFLKKNQLISDDNKETKIPTNNIKSIKIGTTIATNALLQRKGVKSLMIVSKGFHDILQIREQTRPNIFDLSCSKQPPLSDSQNCLQINGRVYRSNICDIVPELKQTKNGLYAKFPTQEELYQLLTKIQNIQPVSIGISLCNSYLSSEVEDQIQQFLKNNGVKCPIEKGSKYISLGYLKRTQTANLNSYLNPISKILNNEVSKYFNNILGSFQNADFDLYVMKSDGGFTSVQETDASKMLLSGPAGGLIGYCKMAQQFEDDFGIRINDMIGLDMGGTSTDVSRVKNREADLQENFAVQGLEICTPHLAIDTIAAGGGSKLGYLNKMLKVGPESVGSNPGPVCYGIGDQLALTDANLLLNRLDPSYFPKVFGKNKNQGPNIDLTKKAFEKLAKEINESLVEGEEKKDIYQLAEGYIQIANELMAKSARKILTLGKPDALVIFGSAGGQHCCDIAEKTGISHIIIHKYSGILSAYGLSKTAETREHQKYLGLQISKDSFDYQKFISQLPNNTQPPQFQKKQYLTLGYMGTGYTLKVNLTDKLFEEFEKKHKEQNGFTLPNKQYKIQSYIQNFTKYPDKLELEDHQYAPENSELFLLGESQVFIDGRFEKINKYRLTEMKNCVIEGPVILLSATSTIFVKKGWKVKVKNESMMISKMDLKESDFNEEKVYSKQQEVSQSMADPIKLTIYSTRLMGIAQQMGKILQKTSISTNIRQRLDFSCGIFDWDGHLLANAPHLPVHLGSMETAVLEQINRGIKEGDVILTNHPVAGGAHLPDITVITCFQIVKGVPFYVASRGHHADIGGISPGSMPPFSRTIFDEGVSVEKFSLMENGKFLEQETRELFKSSRRLNDNISDILAQIAANQIGIRLLKVFARENGFQEFRKYVKLIFLNAKACVEDLLVNFSLSKGFKQVQSICSRETMDDGTLLNLTLTIDRENKTAKFDFSGTGCEVVGNTNAPKSITRSAILYCLRCLIGQQIPLNSGCLLPIQIQIPEQSIISPSKDSAVVGGNVETSQKLVDLILKPFEYIAGSQGTMNNFLFGNDKYCYYETICGGSGAGPNFNGKTIQCHMTNTRITDIQHLQKFYPVVLVEFGKNLNSGGKGKKRGGDGAVREVLFLQQMEVSLLSERRIFPAYGISGGQSGKVGRNILVQNGIKKNIGGKNCFKVHRGDIVRIETPGGGGYGSQMKWI